MSFLLINLLCALAWVALTGEFTPVNFIIGFALGYMVLRLTVRSEVSSKYFKKGPQLIGFAFYFAWEVVKANLQVAYEVVTPGKSDDSRNRRNPSGCEDGRGDHHAGQPDHADAGNPQPGSVRRQKDAFRARSGISKMSSGSRRISKAGWNEGSWRSCDERRSMGVRRDASDFSGSLSLWRSYGL